MRGTQKEEGNQIREGRGTGGATIVSCIAFCIVGSAVLGVICALCVVPFAWL